MEGLFRQIGIYAPEGQLYEPWTRVFPLIAKTRKVRSWRGITEKLCHVLMDRQRLLPMPNHSGSMVPFFIFYSMFGFQRVGAFTWAAGDSRAKGFLMGATAGRTTLNGEGLQHEDGHGLLLAATHPTCQAYDPTFAYELAVIIQDGLKCMYADDENYLLLHHADE